MDISRARANSHNHELHSVFPFFLLVPDTLTLRNLFYSSVAAVIPVPTGHDLSVELSLDGEDEGGLGREKA